MKRHRTAPSALFTSTRCARRSESRRQLTTTTERDNNSCVNISSADHCNGRNGLRRLMSKRSVVNYWLQLQRHGGILPAGRARTLRNRWVQGGGAGRGSAQLDNQNRIIPALLIHWWSAAPFRQCTINSSSMHWTGLGCHSRQSSPHRMRQGSNPRCHDVVQREKVRQP